MKWMRFAWIVGACAVMACGPDHRTAPHDAGSADGGGADARAPDPDAGTVGGELGAPCAAPSDCASGICFPTGAGMARCSEACESNGDCPPGWACGVYRSNMVCTCEAQGERCNALDDDCDGRVDEGPPESIGCAMGELCTAGACACPSERQCGGPGCTDIDNDPLHCGACGHECASTQRCVAGSCCTPSAETCNGADDDCDGSVDEGGADCGPGEVCTAGACTCPAAAMCGGSCVDLDRNPSHCGSCGRSCGGAFCIDGDCCERVGTRVDVLFLIDNSVSMLEEQESLAAQLPRIVSALATGDVDGDGTPESAPVDDLHLGVVTSDMGTGGFAVPTCPRPDFGDDGILRTQGRSDLLGCAATYPSFLTFEPGVHEPDDVAAAFACVAQVGTSGCGFEQPLEAVLKALTPSSSPIRFFGDTRGHGDGANAGFLRPDSILVTLLLTDENDCSASDPELFDPTSSTYSADLNLRCFAHPGALHPVSRYVDGLAALRSDPRDLIFAVITGIPVDLESPSPDYGRILSDPRMVEQIDPAFPSRLVPSCDVGDRGVAFPPRRIVRVAEDLEARGAASVIGSICQEDYSGPVTEILTRIAARLGETCLSR
ncbi:MAG TPA: hypothetical protein VIL20_08275 [Sandaracinaceae bacterium]